MAEDDSSAFYQHMWAPSKSRPRPQLSFISSTFLGDFPISVLVPLPLQFKGGLGFVLLKTKILFLSCSLQVFYNTEIYIISNISNI